MYERLHGEGVGQPEDGIEVTGFVVRALGLAERRRLAGWPGTGTAAAAAESSTRQAYWHKLGGFVNTPVVRLQRGAWEASSRRRR